MKPTGLIVYRGPSVIDGAPIVAAVTFDSANSKTGPMAQAWVLRADQAPMDAIRSGADRSICGNCVHRSGSEVGRSCYVVPWFGPANVYRQAAAGVYPELELGAAARACSGEVLRIAAYGDPAAVPYRVWRTLLLHVAGSTGYTHQWRTCDQRFRSFCMASVESEAEADLARSLGWRFFRARLAGEPLRADEIVCPASDEAGHRITCATCRLCAGAGRARARSIAIIVHGQGAGALEQQRSAVPA